MKGGGGERERAKEREAHAHVAPQCRSAKLETGNSTDVLTMCVPFECRTTTGPLSRLVHQ